jgi:hypothetical protein
VSFGHIDGQIDVDLETPRGLVGKMERLQSLYKLMATSDHLPRFRGALVEVRDIHRAARDRLEHGQIQQEQQECNDFDGAILVNDAVGVAQELAEGASATLLALDPYDEETDQMWRTRFGMRPSRTTLRVSGSNGPLKRLFVPLR